MFGTFVRILECIEVFTSGREIKYTETFCCLVHLWGYWNVSKFLQVAEKLTIKKHFVVWYICEDIGMYRSFTSGREINYKETFCCLVHLWGYWNVSKFLQVAETLSIKKHFIVWYICEDIGMYRSFTSGREINYTETFCCLVHLWGYWNVSKFYKWQRN